MQQSPNEAYSLTDAELKSLQTILLEMLLEVDRICRKHDIKYTLIAGTLLGAVRHGGFIPWDDDLDITMLREEYIRFRMVCVSELDSEKYFFQDHTTDKNYPWGYARVRRKNTEFVRVGQEHLKMKTGFFIDIFPVDNVSNNYFVRVLQGAYCTLLRKILYAQVGRKSAALAALRMWYYILSRIPRSFVFTILEKTQKKWNKKKTKWVRCMTFPAAKGGNHGYPRYWYDVNCEIEFEGYMFQAINAYREYLTYKYGDYMALPPPEKRHWHPVSKFKLPEDNND